MDSEDYPLFSRNEPLHLLLDVLSVNDEEMNYFLRFLVFGDRIFSWFSIDPIPPFCEGDGDVVGVVTPLVRGGAQVLHGDQVVELSVQLEVQEREEEGEDGEGQIEVESERGELKERRTCTWMT